MSGISYQKRSVRTKITKSGLAAIVLITMFSTVACAGSFSGQVDGLAPPDAARPCVFFSIVGVNPADPVVQPSWPWIAIPQSENGFKETYALLLAAKLSGTPVTVQTTGAPVPGCDGYVGLANLFFNYGS